MFGNKKAGGFLGSIKRLFNYKTSFVSEEQNGGAGGVVKTVDYGNYREEPKTLEVENISIPLKSSYNDAIVNIGYNGDPLAHRKKEVSTLEEKIVDLVYLVEEPKREIGLGEKYVRPDFNKEVPKSYESYMENSYVVKEIEPVVIDSAEDDILDLTDYCIYDSKKDSKPYRLGPDIPTSFDEYLVMPEKFEEYLKKRDEEKGIIELTDLVEEGPKKEIELGENYVYDTFASQGVYGRTIDSYNDYLQNFHKVEYKNPNREILFMDGFEHVGEYNEDVLDLMPQQMVSAPKVNLESVISKDRPRNSKLIVYPLGVVCDKYDRAA